MYNVIIDTMSTTFAWKRERRGNVTSFSRPTIYNYFQRKEEIFLALFEREYDRWNEDLRGLIDGYESLTKAELADKIAESLTKREQLLKLLSMNNFDMEANSRQL